MALRICVAVTACVTLAAGSLQFVFDDMDASVNKNTAKMLQSTCGANSYNGKFHIEDNSTHREGAYFEFKFEVTQHGCYSLEEFHPSVDATCSHRLASSARLDVDWCKGQQSTLAIDQSRHGGRWNFVAIFPFYVGWEGALRLSRPKGAGQLLAVDAFRLTRIGDRCTLGMQTQLWREDQALKRGVSQEDLAGTQWQEGSLRLSVQTDSKLGAVEQLSSLRSMKFIIEGTLKSHLGALAITVEDIEIHDGRRLAAGCRRLQSTGRRLPNKQEPNPGKGALFEVSFHALVSSSSPTAAAPSSGLVSKLSAALAGAGARIELQSAKVSWLQAENSTSKDEDALLLPILLGVGALVLLVAGAGVALLCVRRTKARSGVSETVAAQADVEAAKEVETAKDAKNEDVDDNASTITPQSDPKSDTTM